MIGEVQHVWITRGYYGPEERGDWFGIRWRTVVGRSWIMVRTQSHRSGFWLAMISNPSRSRSLGIEARQKLRLIGGRFRQIETDDDAHFKVAL